jgi:hypothetical protein
VESPSYDSPLAYEDARIHAAAVYCSDGRVGAHFDDFLQRGLGLPRYDRLAVPGGPVALAGREQARSVAAELRFLAEAHGLEQVVLIAHQGCAFYSELLGLDERDLERAQHQDLARAAAAAREATGLGAVAGYFARRDAGAIRFERVEV